jgi:2-(1,2-epoxy-1,2-dihydrophenyl)acetyl-CoA isomerase
MFESKDYATISVTHENQVTEICLNRPEKLNSFNVVMHEELRDALDSILEAGDTRAVILTGAGRGFCAGQDLSDRAVNSDTDKAPNLGDSVEKNYNPLIRRLTTYPMPVICAVNGVAAGAGASITMACDFVIAARSASFILSFAKIGLVPDSGSSWHLARAIGLPRAKALAMLGNKLTAEQAEQWGLIYQVVDDELLMDSSRELAAYLATQPTTALANIKSLLNSSFDRSLMAQLELERDAMYRLGQSADYQEGVAAFIEKRPAKFKGK